MPKYTDSPYNLSDKLQRLQEAKSEKLQGLSSSEATPEATPEADYEPAVMTSLHDLDSPGFEGVTGGKGTHGDLTGKESRDRIEPFDSYEVRPDEQWQLDSLLADPARVKQLDNQRSRLAGERGVPLDEITYEDVFQEGGTDAFRFMVNAAADAQGDPEYSKLIRDWQIPEETSERFRTENPGMDILNIPVERADSGRFGAYGRPLTEARTLDGEHIGEAAGYINADTPASGNGVGTTKDEIAAFIKRRRADNAGLLDRAGNAVDAFQKTMFKEVGIDLADLVGEGLNSLTGGAVGWDLGTEEEKTAFANEVAGFKPHLAEEDYKQAEIHAKNIADALYDKDKDLDSHDVYSLVKIGLTTPEMLGDSLGFIASMFVPVLGWGGKAAKAKKAIDGIEAAQKAGKITKEVAETAIRAEKANVHVLNKMQTFTQNNAGLLQMSAGNVNDQIDSYKQEHGEGPSVFKVGQMFATESLLLGLERWTDMSILKSPAALKGAREAFTILAPEGKARVLAKAVGVAGGLAVNMGKEAGQEYLQEIGQEFNVKFNFDDNDTFVSAVSEAGDVFLDKDMQQVGILGAGLGAGGSLQFSAAGAVGRAPFQALSGAKDLGARIPSRKAPPTTSLGDIEGQEPVAPASEDEVSVAKKNYADILNRLNTDTLNKDITPDNISIYLDDIEELNRTKHVIDSSSPGKQKEGERVYNQVIDRLEEFIRKNPDIVLTKKINRKTVKQSLTDKELEGTVSSLSPEAQKATRELAAALGDGEERDVKAAIAFLGKRLKSADYESVIKDEEVMAPYLQNMERALTGSVSEDLPTTFTNVQKSIQAGFKPAPSSDTSVASAEATVLGSGPSQTSTTEEGEYDDYTRSVEAERIVQTLLGSGRTYDDDFTTKLFNFAKKNGVKDKDIDRIKKSYASVDDETLKGSRGYPARLSRIRALTVSSNPDKKALKREASDLAKMESTIAGSAEQLSRGISQAKQVATQRNRRTSLSDEAELIKTEYVKDDGKRYDIWVRKGRDGKWFADVADAEKRMARKNSYVKDIKETLLDIAKNATPETSTELPSFGRYQVPVNTTKDVRTKDDGYIKNVTKTLDRVGLSGAVNKVILGGTTSKKWNRRGDYYKANSLIVNNNEFTEDDVVLVNSLGTTKKNDNYSVTDLFTSEATKKDNMTDAQSSFAAAVDSGATIVLDSDLLSKENKKAKDAIVTVLTRNKGYTPLEGYNSSVFVKETNTNKKILAEHKEELAKEAADVKSEKESKSTLVTYARSLDSGINYKTGKPLTVSNRDFVQKQYDELEQKITKEYFGGDKEKLKRFVARELKDQVKNEVDKVLKDPNPAPLDYKDKSLEQAVAQAIADEEQKDIKGGEVLQEWKDVAEVEGLAGKKRERKVKDLIESWGATPKALVESIMGKDRSFSAGQDNVYELVYEATKTGHRPTPKMVRTVPTDAMIQEHTTNGITKNGQKYILIEVRRVVQDPAKLVSVERTTVLNSIPISSLPFILREMVSAFTKDAFKALDKVSPAELSENIGDRVNGQFLDGNHNLYNSPARGIIFNKDGKPNQEVLAAMALAIGELLKTDMRKMTRGYKTDADLAQMFGVQEHEVTEAMRDHAKNHGAFLKTVANSVGKTVMRQLGLSKVVNDDISYGEYEALVADMGNSALLFAEQQGILEARPVKSDVLAKMYIDGEVRNDGAVTHFINVKDRDVTTGKYTNKEPIPEVKNLVKQFEELSEKFPEAVLGRRGPSFRKPTDEQIEKAKTKVRNDSLGLSIPSQAQAVLEQQMNTAYDFPMDRVSDFLELVDAPGSKIKELLGFIPEGSDKFEALLYKDKESQPAKNRDIEKSIEELRLLKARVEKLKEDDPSMYFEYYYTGNHRYNLDSNTVDPMNDKLHRFLMGPKLHKMKYSVSKYDNGALKFTATSSTGTSDQSYTVRMALAQAFGMSTDKQDALSIVQLADAALGMSKEQIDAAKKDIVTTGKHTFTDRHLNTHEIKADHITHTLQALDFLYKFREGGDFESSLSLEFDALTSGFANKAQQMPILKDMSAHYARTGVLTEEQQRILREHLGYKGAGIAFDPKEGHSISDVIKAGSNIGFFDSYTNLAKATITRLASGEVQSDNLTPPATTGKGMSGMGIFNAIKSLLPGGELVQEGAVVGEIKGAIRELFKSPFMIFNYSAGINRIVTNMGMDVAENLVGQVATTDFADDSSPEAKQKAEHIKNVATNLLKNAEIFVPKSDPKKRIKTAEEFQALLREYNLKSFSIRPIKIDGKNPKAKNPTNLETLLVNTIKLTYGEIVKEVFENEFKPFIEVQDAMNDNFKVAFRIFDKKRVDLLSKIRKSRDNRILTAEDHAKVLEDLWDDFPWIVGPLTGSQSKDSVRKDVIAIASSTTRTPRSAEQARVSPQTRLGSAHASTRSRTVTPLMRYLEEAQNAGSVLPFHAIDGAEMGLTLLDMGIPAFVSIHDATIPPIDMSDLVAFTYNRNKNHINGGHYVLADALQGLADRIRKTTSDPKFASEYKDVTSKGLKALEKTDTFPDVAKRALDNLEKQIKIINDAREEYYGPEGLLKNAWHGNLVSTPGGMYREGMIEPDLSYKEKVALLYDTGIAQPPAKRMKPTATEWQQAELDIGEKIDKGKDC